MKYLTLLLTFVLVLASCKKEKQAEPEIPVTPVTPTGNLSGKVNHFDQFASIYTTGLNTTSVSIEGKDFSAITDQNGRYVLTNVPAGTYTLVFKKPGCGLIKLEKVQFKVDDTTTYNADIADIPAFSITTAYAKDTSWFSGVLGGIYYNTNVSTINSKARVVAIIGKSTNITLSDPNSYLNYPEAALCDTVDFKKFFSYPLLKDTYGFKKDSILYMKIYPVSNKGGSYYNNKLNTVIYTAYGTPYPTVFSLYVN